MWKAMGEIEGNFLYRPVSLTKAENGWIVYHIQELTDGTHRREIYVFEDLSMDPVANRVSFAKALDFLSERFDVEGIDVKFK